ncbi:primase-helicase-like zinc-binding protein [Modicisalibacter xianhensis]|uniref:Primase-helicase-like zinc-binding protein n=1 Tax=Modicisalibacter xianhensis TaxID=442341 RepID=A0A4R8FJ90_9GAMM|nr:toprim domain-containing protein [Halomonas xianhensis]TDX23725.1 primase-helicase-like zinc-binding protein [Halomonas xianhensis]
MQDDMYYHADEVRQAAIGRWPLIVGALAPHLEPALRKIGKHVSCPIHGGKDGFRLFKKDFNQKGGGVCNTCGPKHDGFELLMWANNWSFWETKERIGELLGLSPRHRRARNSQRGQSRQAQSNQNVTVPQAKAQQAAEGKARGRSEPADTKTNLEDRSAAWLLELQEKLERQKSVSSAQAHKSIQRVWDECVGLDSPSASPVWRYFTGRGLVIKRSSQWMAGDCLRFHPSLPYYEECEEEVTVDGNTSVQSKVICKGNYPALVCAIRDKSGKLLTLHRTYLTQTGSKAKVKEARKMMTVPDDVEVVGGAIRMGEPAEGVLGVAEGLETALSGYRASGLPTWSLVNTTLLEGFVPPDGVHTVVIWVDKDKSHAGERAAMVLKSRLESLGIRVVMLIPALPIPARAKGIDWNDVLQTQGLLGFPNPRRLRADLIRQEVAYGS